VHIRKGAQIAKFWIYPSVQLAENMGFSASEINRIMKIVDTRQREIMEAWNEYFGE
jgi:hypothetical protein